MGRTSGTSTTRGRDRVYEKCASRVFVFAQATLVSISYAVIEGNVDVVHTDSASVFRSSLTRNAAFIGNSSLFLFEGDVGNSLSCSGNEDVTIFDFGAGGHASGQCSP